MADGDFAVYTQGAQIDEVKNGHGYSGERTTHPVCRIHTGKGASTSRR
jgi:hypothetical protein